MEPTFLQKIEQYFMGFDHFLDLSEVGTMIKQVEQFQLDIKWDQVQGPLQLHSSRHDEPILELHYMGHKETSSRCKIQLTETRHVVIEVEENDVIDLLDFIHEYLMEFYAPESIRDIASDIMRSGGEFAGSFRIKPMELENLFAYLEEQGCVEEKIYEPTNQEVGLYYIEEFHADIKGPAWQYRHSWAEDYGRDIIADSDYYELLTQFNGGLALVELNGELYAFEV